MKKSKLAIAVVAITTNSGAYTCPITASFNAVQIVTSGFDITATCPGSPTPFTISGPDINRIQMQGQLCLEPYGPGVPPMIRLDFSVVTGEYAYAPPVIGTTFGGSPYPLGGSIQIDIQTTSGWMPYGVVDVANTALDCTAKSPGAGNGLNNTGVFGLQIAGSSAVVPGVWNGNIPDATEALSICDIVLFGQDSQLFIGP